MQRITGTWFERRHHSTMEGTHYNPALRAYTAEQWKAQVGDIADLGMDTLVLMNSSIMYEDSSESYAPVSVFPPPEGMACQNAMDVMMETAAQRGLRVFLSVGFCGYWADAEGNMRSPEVEARSRRAAEELYARYSGNPAFVGWYLPDETEAGPYFAPVFMDYIARYTRFLRAIDPDRKILIAPYGTNRIVPDDTFVDQLMAMDVDYIAYQDEVGVEKSTPEQTGAFYEGLRRAHDRAGRSRLWCDLEIFAFEGRVYGSPLVPAGIERVQRQLEAVSPHVDKVLCYAYPGMMAKPGSIAGYGSYRAPEKLYADYLALAGRIGSGKP